MALRIINMSVTLGLTNPIYWSRHWMMYTDKLTYSGHILWCLMKKTHFIIAFVLPNKCLALLSMNWHVFCLKHCKEIVKVTVREKIYGNKNHLQDVYHTQKACSSSKEFQHTWFSLCGCLVFLLFSLWFSYTTSTWAELSTLYA